MTSHDYSLSVGIDHYPGLGNSLHGAVRDATAFHQWALDNGVHPDRACLIVSSDFPEAEDAFSARPVDQDIFAFIERLRKDAGDALTAGRRLYMFFSGHGFATSIDSSAVLLANTDDSVSHTISPKAWAERFYENGLFDEVILFQDACREKEDEEVVVPPYLKLRPMTDQANRRRFVALAGKSDQLALEKEIDGQVRGIFSVTLIEGLAGNARDKESGDLTAASLSRYLSDNMVKRLTDAEKATGQFATYPEFYGSEPLVILPAAAFRQADGTLAAPPEFPVRIAMPGGAAGRIVGDGLAEIAAFAGGAPHWEVDLPLGIYEVQMAGGGDGRLFKVTGALNAAGGKETVRVD